MIRTAAIAIAALTAIAFTAPAPAAADPQDERVAVAMFENIEVVRAALRTRAGELRRLKAQDATYADEGRSRTDRARLDNALAAARVQGEIDYLRVLRAELMDGRRLSR